MLLQALDAYICSALFDLTQKMKQPVVKCLIFGDSHMTAEVIHLKRLTSRMESFPPQCQILDTTTALW